MVVLLRTITLLCDLHFLADFLMLIFSTVLANVEMTN